MAAINTGKVVTAGLAAGLVLNVIDFVANTFILGNRMKAELDAVNPQLWSAMNDPKNIAWFVALDFLLGILIVWLYAAIRPRFGAGPSTAVRAGVFAWVVASLMWLYFYFMGLTSMASYAMGTILALLNFVVSAWVGGRLYAEAD
jgi:uncharacterized membrane protein